MPLQAQVYQTVRVEVERGNEAMLEGLALDHGLRQYAGNTYTLETVLSEEEVALARSSGVFVTVLEPDATAAYLERSEAERMAGHNPIPAFSSVSGFTLGSMGGFHTFSEAVAELDRLHNLYPEIIGKKFEIGRSHENRPIWAVRVGAAASDELPQALYTSLLHAREPASLSTLLYFLNYLGEQYGINPEVDAILGNRVLWFVPIVNPDGYVRNEMIAPNGGGMWRKNRRNNGGGSFGVDLNRNFGYNWGMDNQGSSGHPNSEVYRGPSAFSEPETAALRDFILARSISVALNNHTHGNYLLHPWGYAKGAYTADQTTFTALCRPMVSQSGYLCGQAADLLYAANGDSDDWMYATYPEKDKILAFTPELGSSFWPSSSAIVPIGEENLRMNLEAAHVAGGFPSIAEARVAGPGEREWVGAGQTGSVSLDVLNAVAANGAIGNAVAYLTSADAFVVPAPGVIEIDIAANQTTTLPAFEFTVDSDAPPGYEASLSLALHLDTRTVELPFSIIVGEPVEIFADNAASLSGWTTTTWGLDNTSYTTAPSSFADSPGSNYPNNTTRRIDLAEPIDLSVRDNARLIFWARWDIERDWDAARVQASSDGQSWTSLAGHYTRAGSGQGVQGSGEPLYDGSSEWVEESIDMAGWVGGPLYLRFELRSDGSVTGWGINVDDIRIVSYQDGTGVDSEPGTPPATFVVTSPFPNPARESFRIDVTSPSDSDVHARMFDILGREVALVSSSVVAGGQASVFFRGLGLSSGLYIVQIEVAGERFTRRVTVLN